MATKPSLMVVADFPFADVAGTVYAETPWDASWARLYERGFDHVYLVGRRRVAAAVPPGWIAVDRARFEVLSAGDWTGPVSFLANVPRLLRAVSGIWERVGALYLKLFYLNSVAVWFFNRLQRGSRRKPVATLLVGDQADAVRLRADVFPFAWLRAVASRVVSGTIRAIQRRADVAGFWGQFLERKFGTPGRRSLVVIEPWLHEDQIRMHDRLAPRAAPTILFVGRLIPRKRAHLLLEAVATLDLPTDVVIVGDGPERNALEALAGDVGLAGRVTFRGWLGVASPEALAAYDEADILCLPSFAEGIPLVVLEAMGRGVAVVATDVSGTPEVVIHEQSGLLVPRDDVPALITAMRRLLTESRLWRRCVDGGYEVARRFTFEAQRKRLADATMGLLR